MKRARDPSPEAARAAVGPLSTVSLADIEDAEFSRRLDLWGAFHRLGVAGVTMALTFVILPQPDWLLWPAALYLALAALVPTALERAASAARRAYVRSLVLAVDVGLVSLFVYRWGARSSPAPFMYLPIVSGWTLIPQRYIGRCSAFAVLVAYGGLLTSEQLGWLQSAVHAPVEHLQHSGEGAIVYFVTLACALAAVHGMVDFTVRRLQRHGQLVSQLAAENRARERELQLAAQLEEAQRLEALGRLAGGIAHDFNNLLTVLIGCAELAETSFVSSPAVALRALRDLQIAAGRGASLTSQLLDFARRRPAQPRNIDLNEMVVRAGQLLAHLLDAEVQLRVRTSAEPCVVHVDPSGIERVLLNLAVNARDAMPEGGTLTLALGIREREGVEQVVLEVSDTGAGISSEDLVHIFEPFFTTKARGKGTGLGLASVYGIVKQSHGQIEVDSTAGQGTSFRLRWPRVHARAELTPVATGPTAGGRELILLVDDHPEVRLVALAHLQGAGYQVISAASGEEALALLNEHGDAVRMIVSDVSMPGMSGVELAAQVRVQNPELPILLISGYSDELHGKSARLAHYLAKPFTGQQLLGSVRRALDGEDT